MAQQLKRWESPRKEGRNDKGRGGSARRRQKAKQFKRLKQTLIDLGKAPEKPTQAQDSPPKANGNQKAQKRSDYVAPFLGLFCHFRSE